MKRIFLTGASAGIGLATARALTDAGHEVWGTSRDLTRLPQLPRFHPLVLDLAESESIARAFRIGEAEAGGGGFDVVINNAGSGHFHPAEALSAEMIREQFQLLVFAQIDLCQAALRSMEQQGRGLLINVTSLASRLPVPFTAAYNAGKAAMASFTMTMQLEFGDSSIHIVDLQPADINTGFNESVRRDETSASRYRARLDRAWKIVNENMGNAPPPQLVARRIVRLVQEKNPPPRVTVGDIFQSRIAPAIFSLLPPRVRVWGLRQYYKI
jgi:NAD(P)-dependent dehydrogenase (short-subunit alcohol dehydrogenase family)